MTIKESHKIESGALQLTIFICVIIALLLAGLILYSHTVNFMKSQSESSIANIKLADAGISWFIDQSDLTSDTLSFLPENDRGFKGKGISSFWGVFQKIVVVTEHRKKKFYKSALVGSDSNREESPTLLLEENYTPLSLVGSTTITGNAYLPSQGVRSGYIAGESYNNTQLIYGAINNGKTELPKLNLSCVTQLYGRVNSIADYEKNDIHSNLSGDYFNSFYDETKNISSSASIELNNVSLRGNFIVKSAIAIRVRKTAFLKDVILIAPIIEVEDGTSGSFQALASKKILIGESCALSYPSALILVQDNKLEPESDFGEGEINKIIIGNHSEIKGMVGYLQTRKSTNFNTQIFLEKDSQIVGQVYCQGNFELRGKVSGSVYTKQFVTNVAGSIYMNHLYNATIENTDIPFHLGNILLNDSKKTIVKWLY